MDAILGHNSAHSLATGPIIVEPFNSPLGFAITPAFPMKERSWKKEKQLAPPKNLLLIKRKTSDLLSQRSWLETTLIMAETRRRLKPEFRTPTISDDALALEKPSNYGEPI